MVMGQMDGNIQSRILLTLGRGFGAADQTPGKNSSAMGLNESLSQQRT